MPSPCVRVPERHGLPRYLQQRLGLRQNLDVRVSEAVHSLNCLLVSGAGAAKAPGRRQTDELTAGQSQVFARLRHQVGQFPRDPVQRADREALLELLKRSSFYDSAESTVARFEWGKLNLLGGTVPSQPLRDRLPEAARDLYDRASVAIEKSAGEVECQIASGEIMPIQPYWDVRLRSDGRLRLRCMRRLLELNLGVVRPPHQGSHRVLLRP